MPSDRGFTLIEVLIATAVLVVAVAAAVSLFSYSIVTNVDNGQRTVATLLLADKMEEFRAARFSSALWVAGGGLDPDNPITGYFDCVTIAADGTAIVTTTPADAPYLRIWQVDGNPHTRKLTVVVYTQRAGLLRKRMELIRASTMAGNTF